MSKRRTDYSYTHSQHYVEQKNDGYVRTRCRECGKKLKARKEFAGQMFICKYCKTPNVLPFLNEDGIVTDDAAPPPAIGTDGTALTDPGLGAKWRPQAAKVLRTIPEVAELKNALFQAYSDALERAENVATDPELSSEKRKDELLKIRRDLDMKIRILVRDKRNAIKEKVQKLRNHPMAKSVAIREELNAAIRQYEAFTLLADTVFA